MSILKNKQTIVALIFVLGFIFGYYFEATVENSSNKQLIEKEESLDETKILQKIIPMNCKSSSQLNEFLGCENLFDNAEFGWEDNRKNCKDQWIEFEFTSPAVIEFIVMQNYKFQGEFVQKDVIKDIELIFDSDSGDKQFESTLDDSTISQWIDTYTEDSTKKIRLNIISSHNKEGTDTCHLEEVTFYGYKGISNGK